LTFIVDVVYLVHWRGDELEIGMANSVDDNSPMVKLAEAILDDPHGISEEALEALKAAFGSRPCPRFEKMLGAIEGTDGRVYLPEDWDA